MRAKGAGSLKDVSLIVIVPQGELGNTKTGKMIEIQKDQSLMNPDRVITGAQQKAAMSKQNSKGEAQNVADTNPYLVSKERTIENEKGELTYVDHKLNYATSQIDKIVEAAGDKNFELEKDGRMFTVYGIKADLRITKDGKGFAVDTSKEMSPSDNKHFGIEMLEKQEAVTQAAKIFRDNHRDEFNKIMGVDAKETSAKEEKPKAKKAVKAEVKEVKVNTSKETEAEAETPNV